MMLEKNNLRIAQLIDRLMKHRMLNPASGPKVAAR